MDTHYTGKLDTQIYNKNISYSMRGDNIQKTILEKLVEPGQSKLKFSVLRA